MLRKLFIDFCKGQLFALRAYATDIASRKHLTSKPGKQQVKNEILKQQVDCCLGVYNHFEFLSPNFSSETKVPNSQGIDSSKHVDNHATITNVAIHITVLRWLKTVSLFL